MKIAKLPESLKTNETINNPIKFQVIIIVKTKDSYLQKTILENMVEKNYIVSNNAKG